MKHFLFLPAYPISPMLKIKAGNSNGPSCTDDTTDQRINGVFNVA